MKPTIKYIAMILLCSVFVACEDYLDVNKNPGAITDPSPDLTLASGQLAITWFMQNTYNTTASFWAQYYTRAGNIAGVDNRDQYQILPGDNGHQNDYNGLWAGNGVNTAVNASNAASVRGSLGDLQYTADKSEENGDMNTWAVAELMKAYAFQVLVDMFDQIPYEEALDKLNITPKYDLGENVYADLIVQIDAALASIDPGASILGDMVFNGDMSMWVKFGNTLKLKIYMRQSEVNPGAAQAGIASLDLSNILGVGEEAEIIYDHSNPSARHPQGVNDINVQTFIAASSTIIDYMLGTNDPRVDVFFRRPVEAASDNPGRSQRGVDQGAGQLLVGTEAGLDYWSARGEYLINDGSSCPFFSSPEVQFLLAEAALRGWIPGSAQAYYEAAIQASFNLTGVGSANTFITNDAPYPNGTFDQNLQAIMEQKWVALTGKQGIEGWTEWRRTGYPDQSIIAVSPTSVLNPGAFPLRFPFVQREVDVNVTQVPDFQPLSTPVWWDR